MENIIMKELEKREKLLVEYDEKVEKKKALENELESLSKELNGFDKDTLVAEIDELNGYAIKLGFIEVPKEESETTQENAEMPPTIAGF